MERSALESLPFNHPPILNDFVFQNAQMHATGLFLVIRPRAVSDMIEYITK